MTEPIGKLPPQNLEAELSILGGVLLDNDAINKVHEVLVSTDFYREAHRKIFDVMIDINSKGEPVDLITLNDALKTAGLLEDVGGSSFIASLADGVATAANIVYYAKIVKEKAVLRGLINVATEIVTKGYEESTEVDTFLDYAEGKIFEISENKVKPSFYKIKDIVKDSFKIIEELYDKKDMVTGVPSGFEELDRLTSGFQSSDLIIVAGRPSMGKTAFCLNVALNALREEKDRKSTVAFFSLEMSKEQLVTRMLCSEARVDASKLRSGFLAESDWPKLTRAAGFLSEISMYIDDTPAISVLEMRAKSRRLKAEKGLGMIIVDYMQLMRGRDGSETREQEISEISRSLKALAKELHVPVIALSQLSRAVEQRGGDKRPILSDLRESGSIEQDADAVLFVFREEFYNRDDESLKGLAEIIIGKHRNGPTGVATLTWIGEYTRFENRADIDL
ncbi:MAG: replicative DNA helicase [Thermodesulfovibrionia bacterium]|nr:replicative DNA helicase [Thermodesulfovibrionia bacterium]